MLVEVRRRWRKVGYLGGVRRHPSKPTNAESTQSMMQQQRGPIRINFVNKRPQGQIYTLPYEGGRLQSWDYDFAYCWSVGSLASGAPRGFFYGC